MDEQKIFIVNLSKGRVGEGNANLLGSMLITKIYLAAMSRADAAPSVLGKLPEFYLYVDEFQNFANKSFSDILSEARKYKLALTIAHQYIEQMEEEVRAAVFGNVGTMITFRVGAFDAEVLEKEFAPAFTAEDLVNLGARQIYLKLMIDGVTSQPFSGVTMAPIPAGSVSHRDRAIAFSRRTYSRPRDEVENNIRGWTELSFAELRESRDDAPSPSRTIPSYDRAPRTTNVTTHSVSRTTSSSSAPRSPSVQREYSSSSRPREERSYERREPPASPPVRTTPVQKEHTSDSLKEILHKVAAQAEQKESALKTARPKTDSPRNNDKSATMEDRKELKNVLASVLQPSGKGKSEGTLEEEKPKRDASTAAPQQQPKEVPEDVLRKLLTVDE